MEVTCVGRYDRQIDGVNVGLSVSNIYIYATVLMKLIVCM